MNTIFLKSVIVRFQQEIEALKSQNQLLTSRIEELITEHIALKVQIIKLENKLNVSSNNSGFPTSKETYRIRRKTKKLSDRKVEGQPGHQIHSYEMRNSDAVVEVLLEGNICKCGSSLVVEELYITHQKIEIPVIQPVVTEYKLHQKICVRCKRKYKRKLDNYRLLDKNAESIITSITEFFNNSKRDVQMILSQIFNFDLSLGLISSTAGRVSIKLENKYKELID